VHERRGTEWRGALSGDAPALVRWAAGQPIADLTIHAPDLSALFQRAYQDEARDTAPAPVEKAL
jgi:hypothetical protein